MGHTSEAAPCLQHHICRGPRRQSLLVRSWEACHMRLTFWTAHDFCPNWSGRVVDLIAYLDKILDIKIALYLRVGKGNRFTIRWAKKTLYMRRKVLICRIGFVPSKSVTGHPRPRNGDGNLFKTEGKIGRRSGHSDASILTPDKTDRATQWNSLPRRLTALLHQDSRGGWSGAAPSDLSRTQGLFHFGHEFDRMTSCCWGSWKGCTIQWSPRPRSWHWI